MEDTSDQNAAAAFDAAEVPFPAHSEPRESDLRLQRIRDYATESLAKLGPLEANLGLVNSDLMNMAYRLKQAIEKAMETAEELEDFEVLLPAIDKFQMLAKQIDRFTQLELRVRNAHPVDKTAVTSAMVHS